MGDILKLSITAPTFVDKLNWEYMLTLIILCLSIRKERIRPKLLRQLSLENTGGLAKSTGIFNQVTLKLWNNGRLYCEQHFESLAHECNVEDLSNTNIVKLEFQSKT